MEASPFDHFMQVRDNALFVVGDSYYTAMEGWSVPEYQGWRLTKLDLAIGRPLDGISSDIPRGLNGSPSYATAMASDEQAIFVGGFYQNETLERPWVVWKRSVRDGLPIQTFGKSAYNEMQGEIGEMFPGQPAILDMAVAGGVVFLVGDTGGDPNSGTPSPCRIEKRSAETGALVEAFGTEGAVTRPLSCYRVAADKDGLYAISFESGSEAGTGTLRIEKRSFEDGTLVSSFGKSGVYTSTTPAFAVHDCCSPTRDSMP